MKKSFLLLLLSALTLTAADRGFYGDSRPKREVKIGSKTETKLLAGAENMEIVIAGDAADPTRFAGTELQKYLNKRLNTTVPITAKPTEGKISFIVGINEFSRRAGLDEKKLCRDAFFLRKDGNKIYLAGIDDSKAKVADALKPWSGIWAQHFERGSLFAVYDFLERFGGVRFFYHDDDFIIVPSGAIDLPAFDIYERPDFEERYYYVYPGQWRDEPVRVKFNGVFTEIMGNSPSKHMTGFYNRLRTRYIPNCHGIGLLQYPERFGQSHPEYFALGGDGKRGNAAGGSFSGQLCFSSKVTEEIYRDAEAFLGGKPASSRGLKLWRPDGHQPGFFGHHFQDGFVKCRCPECHKHFALGKQATSDFLWQKVADTAGRLKTNKIPGYVTMMAYSPYEEVPGIELPDNLLVMVAVPGPWQPQMRRDLPARWSKKLNNKVWLWNYCDKIGRLALPGIASSTPRSVGKYYKDQAPSIYGAYMESFVDRTIFHYLNYYIASKVWWDNSADVEALLAEHHRLMFGKADRVMNDILDRYEQHWLQSLGGRSVMTDIGPVGNPASDVELWNDVFSPAELKRLAEKFNEAEQLAADNPSALRRIKLFRAEFLAPLEKLSVEYMKLNDAIASFKVELKPSDGLRCAVDGKLDEPFWKNATTLHLQKSLAFPADVKPAAGKVLVAVDPDNLYLGWELEEAEPRKISAARRNSDDPDMWQDDGVEIMLNPSGDRRRYFHIIANALDCVSDSAGVMLGSNSKLDYKWNSDIEVKSAATATGRHVEMRIPRKNLGEFGKDGFVANFTRHVQKGNNSSLYSWSPFLKRSFHELENFGQIAWNLERAKNLLEGGDFELTMHARQRWGKWSSFWNLPPETKVMLDPENFVFGSKSFMMQSKNGEKKLFYASQSLPGLQPGKRYRLSCFIKLDKVTPVAPRGGAFFNVWDDKNLFFPKTGYSGTRNWFKESFEFTAGKNTNIKPNRSYFMLHLMYASGTVWIDGIRLEELQ